MKKILYLLLTLSLYSCHEEQTVRVEINVDLQIKDEDHTSPLFVTIDNKTKSADHFIWTFEGGEPSSSTQKNPEKVIFIKPGEHQITLEAWNDGDRTSRTYTIRVDSTMSLAFKAKVNINNYAPAQFNFTNQSIGGTKYNWTFQGGNPSTYEGANPPNITYNQSGKYTITLAANNGSSTVTTSQEILVGEPMCASFKILPSFEDADDMEAPLRATFETQLQGVETLKWECEGAIISNAEQKDGSIYFPKEGTYNVFLNVSNGKQAKQIEQKINIKANTNLRTHKNIKLGINTAQNTIGSLYSTKLRKSFKSEDIDPTNGASIDIAFMGLNETFNYNYFVSPDKLTETPLNPIPVAQSTRFINQLEEVTFNFTEAQFNAMTTDAPLKNLPIKENANSTYFSNSILPHIVLFETKDGRKGAILVKQMVKNGKEGSYIIIDIKVQKND